MVGRYCRNSIGARERGIFVRSHWLLFNDRDRDAVRTLMAFINGRLMDQRTIDWALRTKPNEIIKRAAIVQSLEFLDTNELKDPWRSAWRMIEESWSQDLPQHLGSDAYRVQRRITAGERSGSLISAIVAAVQPILEISPRPDQSKPVDSKRPRRIQDLFQASLSSQKLVELDIYRLDSIEEVDFLITLGIALEGAVNYGIALGRRLGWEGDHKFWRLGQLYHVGYQAQGEDGLSRDVDEFHQGIAPSVKLLDAVVKRIEVLDSRSAMAFVSRWGQMMMNPIHLRLWASLSQRAELTSAAELVETILSLPVRPFWDVHAFPEIAELRALRFDDFMGDAQSRLLTRIKKGPPAAFWPRGSDPDRVKSSRQYWASRELRRIEVAGNVLPVSTSNWLARHLLDFPDLMGMDSINFGFLSSGTARWIRPEPDTRYNDLVGDERLRALEAALSSKNSSWNDDPAERAADWIRSNDNTNLILSELEATRDGGTAYPEIWNCFGWSHQSPNQGSEVGHEHVRNGDRVLALLELLPTRTIESALQGVAHWLSSWERVVARSPRLPAIWRKLWPIAVAATNGATDEADSIDLNQVVGSSSNAEPADLDTLNTAAGRLVGVFLASCPSIHEDENPFKMNEPLRAMRDSIIAADGKSGLIGRHRLIEDLPYFLRADEEWARTNLVAPLAANDAQSLALWRAIARRTQFTKVLAVIGHQFADRAVDRRLGREARSSLLSSLVLESLHAFREKREPVISDAKVQQTLRAVDDEVRANAAQTVQGFLSWMAGNMPVQSQQSAEELFRSAVAPFLKNVWPQERSLATRGVSSAFADLPATAGEAFSEAVDAIERFLVPFDCWSMSAYGLWGELDGVSKLAFIDSPQKAAAFLRLLDMTIGTSEGSVVPMDLAEALDQVCQVSANMASIPAYRRLATVARRR
jgi:hypothetical protein